VQKQLKIEKQRNLKISNVFLTFVVVFTFLAVGLRIFFSNSLVDKSVEVGKIDHRIDLLATENKKLENQINELSSYDSIANRASKLGFIKASTFAYLDKQKPNEVAWYNED
jgi:cell division protein FtsL